MTHHFAHLAPPGAARPGNPDARRGAFAPARRLVMHRDRGTIPAQRAPVWPALPLTGPRTA